MLPQAKDNVVLNKELFESELDANVKLKTLCWGDEEQLLSTLRAALPFEDKGEVQKLVVLSADSVYNPTMVE